MLREARRVEVRQLSLGRGKLAAGWESLGALIGSVRRFQPLGVQIAAADRSLPPRLELSAAGEAGGSFSARFDPKHPTLILTSPGSHSYLSDSILFLSNNHNPNRNLSLLNALSSRLSLWVVTRLTKVWASATRACLSDEVAAGV